MLEKTGFFVCLDRDNLFVTVHDAVLHAQLQSRNVAQVSEIELFTSASSTSPTETERTQNHVT